MKTLIIAEAGVNHNGSLELAKRLVDVAANAGADIVKFQTFKAENLVTKSAEQAKYQSTNMGKVTTQFEMLKALELTAQMHEELILYCAARNIVFLSTPFDQDAAEFLDKCVALWKVPSGEITNFPFLKFLAKKNKPIILSTGMATLEEVRDATNYIEKCWKENNIDTTGMKRISDTLSIPMLTVLHCTTAYPTPLEEANLNVLHTLKKEIRTAIGYSDHTLGIEASLAAVAIGATVIEKHFTLDKTLSGPDHKASLEPDELQALVKGVRAFEAALGSFVKAPTPSETLNVTVVRKGMYYARSINSGETVSEADILILRPATSFSPKYFEKVISRKLKSSVVAGAEVKLNDFEL